MLLLERASFDMILKNLSILVAWLTPLCLFLLILWKRGMKRYSPMGDNISAKVVKRPPF